MLWLNHGSSRDDHGILHTSLAIDSGDRRHNGQANPAGGWTGERFSYFEPGAGFRDRFNLLDKGTGFRIALRLDSALPASTSCRLLFSVAITYRLAEIG